MSGRQTSKEIYFLEPLEKFQKMKIRISVFRILKIRRNPQKMEEIREENNRILEYEQDLAIRQMREDTIKIFDLRLEPWEREWQKKRDLQAKMWRNHHHWLGNRAPRRFNKAISHNNPLGKLS